MKIENMLKNFEDIFGSSFQHTARVKYGVDFYSRNIDLISKNLSELRQKIENGEGENVHVGLEITLEHVCCVENRFNQILEKYKEVYGMKPSNMKFHHVTQRLSEYAAPCPREFAKEVAIHVVEFLTTPEPKEKKSRTPSPEEIKAFSQKRSIDRLSKLTFSPKARK